MKETLSNGWKIQFKRNMSEKDVFDLLLFEPKGLTFRVKEFAWYTEGWSQGTESRKGYYLKTAMGINAGNGDGVSRKEVPYKNIMRRFETYLEELIEEIDSGEKGDYIKKIEASGTEVDVMTDGERSRTGARGLANEFLDKTFGR